MRNKISVKESYSIQRLGQFIQEMNKCEEIDGQDGLCIYTTGSYGRLEACEYSDIDLFFLHEKEDKIFSKITKTLLDAHIIKTCRKMNFPEFSGDGSYIEIHSVENIHNELGSRDDDYYNYFTARMLLLLESKSIINNDLHDKIIDQTIEKYYKDFNKHEKNFKPIFIVNDVIRFWRTLCLNYEHKRHRKFADHKLTKDEIETKRAEVHIKNLNLKFSRKLTCYSFLLSVLCSEKKVLDSKDIKAIILQTPLQRLQQLSDNKSIKNKINTMLELYFWFLEQTQIEKEQLAKWISVEKNCNFAFDQSREFAKNIFQIMTQPQYNENLMYFLI